MKLICMFGAEAGRNPYFKEIYWGIFNLLKEIYPDIEFTHQETEPPIGIEWCFPCPGGISQFQIVNPIDNRSILISFWDRGMEVFIDGLGWEKYDLKQYIGGLGMEKTSHEILKEYHVEHLPFQYPLGVPYSDKWIEEFTKDYNPEKKIRKAVFIGGKHGTRHELFPLLEKHPLIELYPSTAGYGGRDYFKKLSEYAISLSFNGAGEFTLRDIESMGLNIPVVRSKFKTEFHAPLIPGIHYIEGSESCPQARDTYRGIPMKDIAEQFVNAIEVVINDDEILTRVSNNGRKYYLTHCNTDHITKLALRLINLNKII